MTLFGVINQVGYPGVGDIDDCWCIATIRAWNVCDPSVGRVGITAFRAAAGDPDDGYRDGGQISEVVAASRALAPQIPRTVLEGVTWARFVDELRKGRIAYVAVNSAYLPLRLRFGFTGMHAVNYELVGGRWYIANPLAKEGSQPVEVTESEARTAALRYGDGAVYAVVFTTPEDEPMIDAAPHGQAIATTTLKGNGHYAFDLARKFVGPLDPAKPLDVYAVVKLAEPINADAGGDRQTCYLTQVNGKAMYVLAMDCNPLTPLVVTKAQYDAAALTERKRIAAKEAARLEAI